MEEYRWIFLFSVLVVPMLTDLLFMKVPVSRVSIGIAVVYLWNLFAGRDAAELVSDCLPALMLWVLVRMTGKAGMGDVWIIWLLSAVCGWRLCLEMIFLAAVFFLFFAVCVKKKKEYAFVPWIMVGCYVEWILLRL